jgi:hypothetical protein
VRFTSSQQTAKREKIKAVHEKEIKIRNSEMSWKSN